MQVTGYGFGKRARLNVLFIVFVLFLTNAESARAQQAGAPTETSAEETCNKQWETFGRACPGVENVRDVAGLQAYDACVQRRFDECVAKANADVNVSRNVASRSQNSQSTWGKQFNAGTLDEEEGRSAYEQARRAYEQGDYRRVMGIETPFAERGDPEAQYVMGELFYNGKGVTQNYDRAAEWFSKAAEQSHVGAEFVLEPMHYNGQGFKKNTVVAAEWFKRAADQGLADGQYLLALMYFKGDGVQKKLRYVLRVVASLV